MPPDSDDLGAFAELLRQTSDRAVEAVNELRRELVADRERDDARLKSLEREVGILRRCLTDGDGDTATAKPARLGLDAKFIVTSLVSLLTAGALPTVIVYLITGGP